MNKKVHFEEEIHKVISYSTVANSSRGIDGGANFSAISWSKSLPITVLGSCNIPECYSKVFFAQIYFLFLLLSLNSNQK